MPKLIVGCGYLGLRVARRWLDAGHQVFATTRSASRAEQLQRCGVRPVVADVTRPETLGDLPPVASVLFAVGFEPSGGLSRYQVYAEGLAAVLDALDPSTRRVVFVSSTGVYGDMGGAWVDEQTPCRPESEGGRAFLAAEQRLADHPLGPRSVVLRMAGIYGPDRVPKARDLSAGKPLAVPDAGHVNLIHVDDAAQAVVAAEARGAAVRPYLVSDGHPVPRRQFYTYLAEVLGCAVPQFVDPPARDPGTGRGRTDKRVQNRGMLEDLGVELEFADYRQGLAAIFRGP